MEIRLIDYLPTPGYNHVGIATINMGGLIELSFKVLKKKGSEGYYSVPASYKVTRNGKEDFIPAFVIDSNITLKKIESLITDAVMLKEIPF